MIELIYINKENVICHEYTHTKTYTHAFTCVGLCKKKVSLFS